MADKAPSLSCPTCKKTIRWSDEYPDRPFCSARCKQIDFGEWASERHSIPGKTDDEDDLFSEDLQRDQYH